MESLRFVFNRYVLRISFINRFSTKCAYQYYLCIERFLSLNKKTHYEKHLHRFIYFQFWSDICSRHDQFSNDWSIFKF
mgnify:CR=1 FL=1